MLIRQASFQAATKNIRDATDHTNGKKTDMQQKLRDPVTEFSNIS